jgi:hypothetical protein
MLAFCGMLFPMACTESDVEVKDTLVKPQVDDQLHITGRVCSKPPEDTNFPVKVMFIIDCSGSMQQTDEGDHRVEAVRQVVRRYANNPQVKFNIIKFNGRVTQLTSGFQSLTGNEADVFGGQGLLEADSMTDYQGGLGVAYQALLRDMQGSSLTELTRTKYVIMFFSDGTPDPVCFGCVEDPPNHPRYSPACHEDLHLVCTLMDDIVLDLDYLEPGMFPMLEGGADYNHNYQLFQLVDDIMELKDAFHVGEIRLHTAFLYCRDQFGNPTTPLCVAAELAYNLDPDRGRALLREIAKRGNGTFRDFTSGQDVNFLNVDYTSIKRNYGAKNLIVENINAFPNYDRFLPDSDSDGIIDQSEQSQALTVGVDSFLMKDSDRDGYQDWIEEKMVSSGFDIFDPAKPEIPCGDLSDSDGDGLNGCEEALFETDNKLVDSDFDGFPDLMEIRAGLDPLRNDTMEDLDSDGNRNGDELLYHTHPGRSDPDLFRDHRYWYQMKKTDDSALGRNCYSFDIRHVTLVTTGDRQGTGNGGYNDILVWFDQASYDDPFDPGLFRVACVRAQYYAPDLKIPVDGVITLTDKDFVIPQNLDLSLSDTTTCVGTRPDSH